MIINDQQAIVLLQILKDSLEFDADIGFDQEFRVKLYEVLVEQQSDLLVDLKQEN